MTASKIRPIQFLFLMLAMTCTGQAIADVFSAAGLATKKNVAIKTTSVPVVWRMNADLTCPDPNPITVSSPTITFFTTTGGPTIFLGTVNKRLAKTVDASTGAVLVNFSEGVLIPQSIIEKAVRLGGSLIGISRTFGTQAGCPDTAIVAVNITGSSAAGFGISRETIRFDDNSIIKLLNEKTALQAKADLYYNGTGLIRGIWEVAGPTTTAGTPIFRPLRTVQKGLPSGEKQTFASPKLPTQAAGVYLVRFRIITPLPGFDTPIIRYYVGDKGAQLAPAKPMQLGAPSDRSWLAEKSVFSWHPVKLAATYRLEFYSQAQETTIAASLPNLGGSNTDRKPIKLSGPPVAGVMLPADKTKSGLAPVTRNRLIPGKWYYWRVIALDNTGKIIGISPVREIRVP